MKKNDFQSFASTNYAILLIAETGFEPVILIEKICCMCLLIILFYQLDLNLKQFTFDIFLVYQGIIKYISALNNITLFSIFLVIRALQNIPSWN